MTAGYNPLEVERSWYSWWQHCGYFIPSLPSSNPTEGSYYDEIPLTIPKKGGEIDWTKLDKGKTFVIPAPPPNVTGSLHIGHALAFGIQDTLIRWSVPPPRSISSRIKIDKKYQASYEGFHHSFHPGIRSCGNFYTVGRGEKVGQDGGVVTT